MLKVVLSHNDVVFLVWIAVVFSLSMIKPSSAPHTVRSVLKVACRWVIFLSDSIILDLLKKKKGHLKACPLTQLLWLLLTDNPSLYLQIRPR